MIYIMLFTLMFLGLGLLLYKLLKRENEFAKVLKSIDEIHEWLDYLIKDMESAGLTRQEIIQVIKPITTMLDDLRGVK